MGELLVRGRREMKPLLFKLGIALALSFAGFLVSHLRSRSRLSPPGAKAESNGKAADELRLRKSEEASSKINNGLSPSPSSKSFGDEEGFLLPEFNELVFEEFEASGRDPDTSPTTRMLNKLEIKDEMTMEQEIGILKNLMLSLRERERSLEMQLLEYYGLKEQETAVKELENRLKINSVESKLLSLKIKSLHAENQKLQAQLSDYSRVMAELESARAEIKLLKRKLRSDGELAKEKIAALHQRIATLQVCRNTDGADNVEVEMKMNSLKEELEDETAGLRKVNSILELENAELARKLESMQILASSVLEGPKVEALEDAHSLRQVNDKLTKEIEQLQTDRCSDAEELVYLRWVNACLRYELRNYQPTPGKTVARDLSKSLSPKSEEKAKQLILEYANSGIDEKRMSLMDYDLEYYSSSQASTGESDDTSIDISSTTKDSSSSKSKFFSKLKNLVLGRDIHSNRISSVDRTPTSYSNSERRASVSTCSFDDMIGRDSYDSIFSCITTEHAPANQLTRVQEQADEQWRNKVSRSESLPMSSSDIKRLKRLNLEDVKEVNGQRRISDVGTSYSFKRTVSGEESLFALSQNSPFDGEDVDAPEKVELKKFAEVLKRSRGTPKLHRRAVSYSFN